MNRKLILIVAFIICAFFDGILFFFFLVLGLFVFFFNRDVAREEFWECDEACLGEHGDVEID